MPIINMPVDLLLRLVNVDRHVIDETRLAQTLEEMGVEVEEMATTFGYACGVCENVFERTAAQGQPLSCAKCGSDFRERPAACRVLGENKVARLNMVAVRPDIFDVGGMARYMRGFLGARTGLVGYAVTPAVCSVRVDPRLARDESYRPCIACAIIRNLRLDNERVKLLMNLQEDLHWALGRDRKLASIGVYDLDKLNSARTFAYRTVGPDELRFVPLGFSPTDPAANLTPREILEKHGTGKAYAHLLAGFSAYPLLTDGDGGVLSMPPIINSEATRVTLSTRQCFVDVTGMAQRTVDRALNILVSGVKEVMPDVVIEAVRVEYADRSITTPDFTPAVMPLDVRTAADTIGVGLDSPTLARLLERMGHGVEPAADGRTLRVRVPAWRNDVMHPIDLIEDVAIAHGYQNLTPRLTPTFTIGRPREIEEQSRIVRSVFVGLGFHQVMTLPLTSEPAAFAKWSVPSDERAVRIENPISTEQTICRVSLLPGILETLAINKQYDLPQRLFEVGDCPVVDDQSETGATERRRLAAAIVDTHAGYADIRAVLDSFAHELGISVRVEASESPSYITGRCAAVMNADGERIGTMGELHPQVLENYGLRHAVATLELNLSAAGLGSRD
ncbi:MAG: phenylalanine--tRNA ligase subunit beta [Phycisphaerae bacterium]